MPVSPTTMKVVEEELYFNGEHHISIAPYYGGFSAHMPEISRGLLGKDLRALAVALIIASVRADELNRRYEATLKHELGYFEDIPISPL